MNGPGHSGARHNPLDQTRRTLSRFRVTRMRHEKRQRQREREKSFVNYFQDKLNARPVDEKRFDAFSDWLIYIVTQLNAAFHNPLMLLDSGDNDLLFVEMQFEKVPRWSLVVESRIPPEIDTNNSLSTFKNVKRRRLSDFPFFKYLPRIFNGAQGENRGKLFRFEWNER